MNETILIIDDEVANLRLLCEMLGQRGYELLTARNGRDGVLLATNARPNLILLDIRMPGMDGFEVCARLRQQPETADIPVVFTTIMADLDKKVAAFDLGAVDYIAKPLEEIEVLARVERHLELYSLRRRLQQTCTELEQRNGDLRAFAQNVSHNLRNPLGNLISSISMLRDMDPSSVEYRGLSQRLLVVMEGAARRGLETTDALLRLAEIGQRDMDSITTKVDLKKAAAKALSSLDREVRRRSAVVEWQEEGWSRVVGYRPWVVELWHIYLDNALKYSGEPPEIRIGCNRVGDRIEGWVADNGAGIDREAAKGLFQPFKRLHSGSAGGHGLGLSIASSIVNRLGGEVGVDFPPASGCRFYFRLPQAE